MKKNRILIFTDSHKQADFENSVEATQQGANDLIHIFESFQNYKKIESLSDFESLVSDPLGLFDKTLQANSGISLQASGGKIPNPKIIAEMYDIERDSYYSIIRGEKIVPGSCKSCGKLKIKRSGAAALSYSTYHQYANYLYWTDNNRFSINEISLSEKKETYKYYIEDPEQIKVWNHWNDLCNILNDHEKKGYIGSDVSDKIPALFKNRLTYSYQAGKLAIDEMSLLQEIQSIKN